MAPRTKNANTDDKESNAVKGPTTQAKQTKPSITRVNRFQSSATENSNAQNDVNMFSTNTGDLVFSCFGRRTGIPTWLKYHITCFQEDDRFCDMIQDPKLNIHVFGVERLPPPAPNTSFRSYTSKPDPTKAQNEQTKRTAVNTLFVRFKVEEGEFDDRAKRDRIHRNFVRLLNIIGAQVNTAHQYKQTFKVGTARYGGTSPNLGDIIDPDTFLKGFYFAKHMSESDDEGARRDKIEQLREEHEEIVRYFGMASYAQFLMSSSLPVPSEYAQQLALADVNKNSGAHNTNDPQPQYSADDIGFE